MGQAQIGIPWRARAQESKKCASPTAPPRALKNIFKVINFPLSPSHGRREPCRASRNYFDPGPFSYPIIKKIIWAKQGFGGELLILFSGSFATATPSPSKGFLVFYVEEKLRIFTNNTAKNNSPEGPEPRNSRGPVDPRVVSFHSNLGRRGH